MTRTTSVLLLLLAIVVAACARHPSLADSDAEYSGVLSELLPGGAAGTRFLIVNATHAEPRDRAIVSVPASAEVRIVEAGGRMRSASAGDLRVGDRLDVWTTGVELRSYPVQVQAVRVHILR